MLPRDPYVIVHRMEPLDKRPPPAPPSLTYEENGRHYLADSLNYLFPCDALEANRMDLFHKVVSIVRGGGHESGPIHSAPLHPDHHLRILDLGTGTGLWVVEMADLYAGRSEVWGVDLAPFQPDLIPSNAKFQRLDIEAPWHGLGAASWDLIHARCLRGAVADWPALYAVACHHLVRGAGHIELADIDWTPHWPDAPRGCAPDRSPLATWAHALLACTDRARRPLHVDAAETRAALRAAGFVDVQQHAYQLPFGPAPGSSPDDGYDDGDVDHRWFPLVFDLWLEGLTLAPLSRFGGYSPDAIHRLLADVRREVAGPAMRASCTL